jgi:type I restriction enzyme S subunit
MSVNDEYERHEIPSLWSWTNLKDVCQVSDRDHRTPEYVEGGVPLISPKDFDECGIDFSSLRHVHRSELDAFVKKCNPERGDVLYSRIGTIGKARKLDFDFEFVALHSLALLKPDQRAMHPDWLLYLMKSPGVTKQAKEGTKSVGTPDLGLKRIQLFEVPLPPMAEQQRIVSRIEELFSEIDEGERALERVGQLVERYRQSVLKAAVTGELTREWRARNPSVSAADLLDQFSTARATAGSRGSPIEMAQVEGLPELPASWAWTSLDSAAEVVGGITVDRKRSAEGCDEVPYLRVANVQRGFIDLTEVKTIVAPRERIEALRLAPGDILFNEGGDIDKLGRGWLWQGELPVCIHQNHVFRARLFVPGPWNKLISWFGNVLGKRLFMDMGKQTTNLASLSLSKLKSVPVPLMPYEEAVEIVSRTEDALSLIDKCIAEVARQRNESAALRQSILKAAFSGQLVPQDPRDEPASALLARLAVQAGDAPATPRRRGRTA